MTFLPQMSQIRLRRHRYAPIGCISAYLCPAKRVSVLSVVKKARREFTTDVTDAATLSRISAEVRTWSNDVASDIDFWKGVEVQEKSQLVARCTKVVDQLCRVLCVKGFDCLEFENNLVEADDVGHVKPAVPVLVANMQGLLGDEWNAAQGQFLFKRVLVDFFKEAGAKRVVNFKYRTSDGEGLFLIDVVAHGLNYIISVVAPSPSRESVLLVVKTGRAAGLPQITQMRRKRRHRYPRMEEIRVYPCPAKRASVPSVVKDTNVRRE